MIHKKVRIGDLLISQGLINEGQLNITVIPALKNTKSLSEDQQKQAEGELILRLIQPSDTVVLLDEHGAERTSMEMAAWLTRKQQTARRLVFIIGGPYGFSADGVDAALCQNIQYSFTIPNEGDSS